MLILIYDNGYDINKNIDDDDDDVDFNDNKNIDDDWWWWWYMSIAKFAIWTPDLVR